MKHSKLIIQVLNEDSPVFLKKLKDFKHEILEVLRKILYDIFAEAKDKGEIKERFAQSLEFIVEIIQKWMMISGENVKVRLSEDTVDKIKEEYILLSEIFLNGLIKQEEKK
jgi:septum formation topological specificity factor MinE